MATPRKKFILSILFCCLFIPVFHSVHAEAEVNFDLFYEELAPYGAWVDHPQYGAVWIPNDMPADWRPYTHGHWERTYEHGWLWVSDWEWGWAPFHYGRWFNDAQYGWAWVPGYEWSPAWVAWRSGGEYIGWAPLPPEVGWSGMGLVSGPHVVDYGIAPHHWIFIQDSMFLTPYIHQVILYPPRNEIIIHETRNITRYTIVNNRIVNHCLPLRQIERVTHQPVRVVNVREVEHYSHIDRQRERDTAILPIYRPVIQHVERPVKLYQTPPVPHRIEMREQPIKTFAPPVSTIRQDERRDHQEPIKGWYRQQEQPIKSFNVPPTSPVIINRPPERVVEQRDDHRDRPREPRQDVKEQRHQERIERKEVRHEKREQKKQEQKKQEQKKQEQKKDKPHKQEHEGR